MAARPGHNFNVKIFGYLCSQPNIPLLIPPSSCFSNGVKDANPFDDESEEWDDAGYELTDDGKAGEPVKALYDYEAAEPDELTFKTGQGLLSHCYNGIMM